MINVADLHIDEEIRPLFDFTHNSYSYLVSSIHLERDTGIGPASHPWEGRILPVY